MKQNREAATIKYNDADYRSILEHVFEGIAIVDADARIRYVNTSGCAMLGYTLDEVLDLDALSLIHQDDLADAAESLAETLAHPAQPITAAYRFRRKDGHFRYIEARTVNLLDNPRVHGLVTHFQDVTERKAAEDALHMRNQAIAAFLTPMAFGDAEFRITYANQAFLDLFGFDDLKQIVGMPNTQFVAEPISVAEINRATVANGSWMGEITSYRLDGTPIELQLNACLVTDADGNRLGSMATFLDVTAQKRAVAQLKARERQQAAVAELGAAALSDIPLGKLLDQAVELLASTLDVDFCKVLELGKDGESLWLRSDVGWPDDVVGSARVGTKRGSQAGYTLLADEPVVVEDLRRETRFQGPSLPCNHAVVSGISVVIRGHGGPFGVLGVHTRTWRRFNADEVNFVQTVANVLAEAIQRDTVTQKLAASEQKYRQIVDTAQEGVWVVDAEARTTFANQRLATMFGCSTDDLMEKSPLDFLDPESRADWSQRFERHRSGLSERYEVRYRRPDGSDFWASLSTNPLINDAGEFVGALAMVSDITDRKVQEERIHEHENALAHATRLNTMGEMVAGIAHEINQPLSAIANFAAACSNVLEEQDDQRSEQLSKWTQRISQQAVRCGDIIRQLRNFVRKSEMTRTDVDLNDVVRESLALVRPDMRLKSIDVVCQLGDARLHVFGNRVELQQVLVNLLRNSCDALSQKGNGQNRQILISSRVTDGVAQLTVEDHGPGIDECHVDKVFDAFYTTKQDGMGMGLAISRSIIENHEGRLWAENRLPHGAAFHVELPLQLEES